MPRKKTHEEFVEEMKVKNPNIEILGRYVNSTTKILCKCKIDGNEWYASPDKLLAGRGCPRCAKIIVSRKMSKSHEQFIHELSLINPNIEILGKYINSSSKILVRCKVDEYEWYATPSALLRGQGCPKCKTNNEIIRRTYTNDYVVKLLEQTYPNIVMLEKYKGHNVKIKFKCKVCGMEWYAMPTQVLHGKWLCPKCTKESRRQKLAYDFNYVKNEIETNISEKIGTQLKVLECEEYKTVNSKLTIIDVEGYKYFMSYKEALNTANRRSCFLRFHHSNIYTIYNLNLVFEKIGFNWRCIEGQQYINYKTKLILKNLDNGQTCERSTNTIFANFRKGKMAFSTSTMSIGEHIVYDYLTKNQFEFIYQYSFDDCKYINTLSFDFYLEPCNLLIEVQGEQHYQPVCFGGISKDEAIHKFKIQQIKDNIKREYCKNKNIQLLEIPYWDYKNIEQILESRLLKQSA